MAKTITGPKTASTILVVGGHSVVAALIDGEIKQAIFQALGVAAIAVVFVITNAVLDLIPRD